MLQPLVDHHLVGGRVDLGDPGLAGVEEVDGLGHHGQCVGVGRGQSSEARSHSASIRSGRGLPWGETLPPGPGRPGPRRAGPHRHGHRRSAGLCHHVPGPSGARTGARHAESPATSSSRSIGWTTATRTWPRPAGSVQLAGADQQAGLVGQPLAQRPAVGVCRSGTGYPQVERPGRQVDRQPGVGSGRRPGTRRRSSVAPTLAVHVGVVVERHHGPGLHRARAPSARRGGGRRAGRSPGPRPRRRTRPAPRPGSSASTASGRPPRRRHPPGGCSAGGPSQVNSA